MEAQEQLEFIQGVRGIYYAGAWCGYGFHEDGIRSSVAVVQKLGCSLPWIPRSLCPKWSLMESFWLKTFTSFCKKGIKRGSLHFILPNGSELHFGDGRTDPSNSVEWRKGAKLRATVRVFSMTMFRKLVFRMDTGLAEAFMDGDFAVDDIGSLMSIAAENAASLTRNQKSLGIWSYWGQWLLSIAKPLRSNTIQGSQRNIKKHYDIGNELYKQNIPVKDCS